MQNVQSLMCISKAHRKQVRPALLHTAGDSAYFGILAAAQDTKCQSQSESSLHAAITSVLAVTAVQLVLARRTLCNT